VNNELL